MSDEMLTDIRAESLRTAFKHWQNLAVGTILMAFSAYLTISAKSFITTTTTELQGWAMLVIAGYAFVAALYLGLSILSAHSSLPQSLPGVIDHFKGFIVAGIFYAVGYYLLNIETSALPASQALSQALSLIIGGALFLVAAVIAIASAFIPHK
ncbi:MAG TPA: hypothetical protein VNA15_10425 [Candidatus Angelobacter sp.]|nr:hypothetical protein [Candidatus Angelobacter sp.]